MVRNRFGGCARLRLLALSTILMVACGLSVQDAFPSGSAPEQATTPNPNLLGSDFLGYRPMFDSPTGMPARFPKNDYDLVPKFHWEELLCITPHRAAFDRQPHVTGSPRNSGANPHRLREGNVSYSGKFSSRHPNTKKAPKIHSTGSVATDNSGPESKDLPTHPESRLHTQAFVADVSSALSSDRYCSTPGLQRTFPGDPVEFRRLLATSPDRGWGFGSKPFKPSIFALPKPGETLKVKDLPYFSEMDLRPEPKRAKAPEPRESAEIDLRAKKQRGTSFQAPKIDPSGRIVSGPSSLIGLLDDSDTSLAPMRPRVGLIFSADPNETHKRTVFGCVLPMAGERASIFGEANAEIADLCSIGKDAKDRRLDLSLGGGCRALCGGSALLGANYFFDASRVNATWYSSRGAGFEGVFLLSRKPFQTVDLNVDLYKGGGVGLELGYTRPVLHEICDLRIKASKYRFHDGDFFVGWKAGLDLCTPDRALAVTYEVGQDRNHQFGHTVGCSISIPLSFGNLFRRGGDSVIHPVLGSRQRELNQSLAGRVKREWHQPRSVVEARSSENGKVWTVPVTLNFGKDETYTTAPLVGVWALGEWLAGPKREWSPSLWTGYGVVSLASLGVEHCYRWAFGPFKTDPGPSKDRK